MKFLAIILVAAFALTGCGEDNSVPEVKDAHHPQDFDGTTMKAKDWLLKFCSDKPDNKKCLLVARAMSTDSVKGALPKGW